MLIFQILFVPLMFFVAVLAFGVFLRKRSFLHLFYALIGLCGAIFIGFPELTNYVAKIMGVGRGSDLVTYIAILFFLWSNFQLYVRHKKTEENITLLVREIAIKNPVKTPEEEAP